MIKHERVEPLTQVIATVCYIALQALTHTKTGYILVRSQLTLSFRESETPRGNLHKCREIIHTENLLRGASSAWLVCQLLSQCVMKENWEGALRGL